MVDVRGTNGGHPNSIACGQPRSPYVPAVMGGGEDAGGGVGRSLPQDAPQMAVLGKQVSYAFEVFCRQSPLAATRRRTLLDVFMRPDVVYCDKGKYVVNLFGT